MFQINYRFVISRENLNKCIHICILRRSFNMHYSLSSSAEMSGDCLSKFASLVRTGASSQMCGTSFYLTSIKNL